MVAELKLFNRTRKGIPSRPSNPGWVEMHLANQPVGTVLITPTHTLIKYSKFHWEPMDGVGGISYLDRTLALWLENRVYWLS